MQSLADRFIAETRQRLATVFEAWALGRDVAPGERLRLEGFMQAGIVLGLATRQQVLACMAEICREYLGEAAMEHCEAPFPPMADPGILPLPPLMRRAPVVPSTRD